MTKYQPLEDYLKNKGLDAIPMSFSEIESIIEDGLPPSARKHRAWWSNNPSNSVITYAWLSAGYKSTDVNLEGEKVIFRKGDATPDGHSGNGPSDLDAPARHPLIGYLTGKIVIAEGDDLSEPAMSASEWAEVGKKYDGWT